MSNYTKATNFATKDALPTGNALKIVSGTEIDTEFSNIETAVNTKADTSAMTAADALKANIASPTFTGVPAAPTATAGTNTTQVATTEFVKAAADTKLPKSGGTMTGNITGLTALDVTGTVTADDLVVGGNLLNLSGVSSGTTGARLNANGGGMLRLASGGVDKMYILDSGSVGIGVTPEATHSLADVLQVGGTALIANWEDAETYVGENVYISTAGTYKYLTTSHASLYNQNSGQHTFQVAPSGTADSAISWTTAMTIDNSGMILPGTDNAQDLGSASLRFDDIYATNGTIQTSDRNEKQDILAITTVESNVATACKGLLRSFRWKSAVAEKGDDARIHFGIIAQDLRDAFTAEGLDAGRYAMFTSATWWETQTEVPAVEAEDATEDSEAVEAKDAYTRTNTFDTLEEAPEGATERTRLGVRYPELLSFIIAAL